MAGVPYSERKFDKKHASEYIAQYTKENYDRIEIKVPKGYKDQIKEAAAADGLPMAEWIRNMIDEKLNK